jgi:hypothetical protein
MHNRLRAVIERAKSLSDEEQGLLAEGWERALDELEEQEWETLLRKPGSQQFLKELVSKGREEHAAGKTEEIIGDRLG